MSNNKRLADNLNERAKKKRQKERFIRTRMWISTLMSTFFTDRGTIPDNIGNNMLVLNNVAITKRSLTSLILIIEMSDTTPICWTSDLLRYVKEQVKGVKIDIIIKGTRYFPDVSPQGMSSRERSWTMTLDNPAMPKDAVRRSARCLYSLDVARSGEKLYKGRTYVRVRSADATSLRQAIQLTEHFLHDRCGATYKTIKSNLDEHLAYTLMMSNKKPEHLKDIPPVIYSLQTLAESMPSVQGMNNLNGTMMGYDIFSNFPYLINFRASASMKNIMIEADSGFGKTFAVEWWLYTFYADMYNLCIMDIKGTEFSAITKALNGVTLSMRSTSTYYINTWSWDEKECYDGDYQTYVHTQIRWSKEQMIIISDFRDRDRAEGESLIEDFVKTMYRSIGADPDNRNTWFRTKSLTPYVVAEYFRRYVSHEIRNKYPNTAVRMLDRISMYMGQNGTNSHMYRNEYAYHSVLDSRILTFDFGILEASGAQDQVMFRIHVLFMQIVNDAFVSHKKALGQWTVKVLEESQVVDDYLTQIYTREMTLRRAQNQITILLGNSVSALANNPASRPMLDNVSIMCLGRLNKSSRKFLQEEYGLTDLHEDLLEDIQKNPDMEHTFLLVNRLEKDATTALLRTPVTSEIANSKLFKVVDVEE